jgi:hypothetical protein
MQYSHYREDVAREVMRCAGGRCDGVVDAEAWWMKGEWASARGESVGGEEWGSLIVLGEGKGRSEGTSSPGGGRV